MALERVEIEQVTDIFAAAKLEPFRSYEDAMIYLQQSAVRANVKHLSYWFLQFKDDLPEQVIWVSTYDANYMRRYMSKFTPMGDPVLSALEGERIVDWLEWLPYDEVSQQMYAIAKEYDIPKYGVSLQFPVERFDKFVFSACLESNDADWLQTRSALVKRFKPFAKEFHKRVAPMIAANEIGTAVYSF